MSNFGITEKQKSWICRILSTYLPNTKIYVFGSRARGDQKQYSDLDLAIDSKTLVPTKTLLELQEQFSESSLPFKVDLVELLRLNPEFKQSISSDLKEFSS